MCERGGVGGGGTGSSHVCVCVCVKRVGRGGGEQK